MIKLKDLTLENMTYRELMSRSDKERMDKSSRISSKSLNVTTENNTEAWKFSYKSPSDESTTGLRHQGSIRFLKENLDSKENALDIDCIVDCSCPDYRYRFSYSNKKEGAGINGSNSLNKGQNRPSVINAGTGLCKHLLSLQRFLQTKIDPSAIKESLDSICQNKNFDIC